MTAPDNAHERGIEALLPQEIAERAEAVGIQKARRDAVALFVLGVLAGAFIALWAMFATTVLAGAVGAVGTALLVFLSGQYLAGDGAVAAVALNFGLQKATLPFDRALFIGTLCNVLVCLAVWLSLGARTTTDKVLAIVFPVSAFVVAGFEHSVANMHLIPLALLIKWFGPAALWTKLAPADFGGLTIGGLFANLVPVTIGNIIGGGVLVGAVYWFVYLRMRPR
jgi:formate/nitrite transporter